MKNKKYYTFKIKAKYFNAILELKKTFEIRHQIIPENSIIKLCCGKNYLVFKTGGCYPISGWWLDLKRCFWFDKFCQDYINKKQSYIIIIKKILEVKYEK